MPRIAPPLTTYTVKSWMAKVKRKEVKTKKLTDSVSGLKLKISLLTTGEPSALWVYQKQKSKSCPFTLDMSYGTYPSVSIEAAREWARKIVDLLARDMDPRDVKAQKIAVKERAKQRQEEVETLNFGRLFHQWCDYKEGRGEWSDRRKEERRAKKHLQPLWSLSIKGVGIQDVVKAIEHIWCSHPTTADRILNHLSCFFRWCYAVAGVLDSPINPAERKTLVLYLPPKTARRKADNHPFLEPDQLPLLAKALWDKGSITAMCALFGILCCLRSSNARGIKWCHIADGLLVLPADSMKATSNGQHKIPLSEQALATVERVRPLNAGRSYVFASVRKLDAPLSYNALNTLIKDSHNKEASAGREGWLDRRQSEELGKPVVAVYHGIARATFKTWSEQTGQDARAVELILHHGINDRYNGAYNRAELMETKQKILSDWGRFVFSQIDID